MDLGDRIAYARVLRGYGVNELDKLCGTKTVSRYETGARGGRPGLAIMRKLAAVLKVRFDWLTEGEGDTIDDSGTPAPKDSASDSLEETLRKYPTRWAGPTIDAGRSRIAAHRRGAPEQGWKALLDDLQKLIAPEHRKIGGRPKKTAKKAGATKAMERSSSDGGTARSVRVRRSGAGGSKRGAPRS
jgi:transcriptional regulator with XRE-family HTH domain